MRAAEASATRWRDGKPLSPIDGMPIAIKDIIETADMPTGQGSPLWEGTVSRRDSASVHALREAGAIIIGKTTTTEFAASHPWHETAEPHDPSARRADRRAARPPRSAPAWCRPGSAPRWSARSCGRRASAARRLQAERRRASTAAARTTISARAARAPSARRSPTPGRWCAPSPTAPAATRASSGWPATSNFTSRAGRARSASWKPAAGAPRTGRAQGVRGGAEQACRGRRRARSRADDPDIEAVEKAITDALPLTQAINAWEGRWPLNTYADLDAEKLSGGGARAAEDRRGHDAGANTAS